MGTRGGLSLREARLRLTPARQGGGGVDRGWDPLRRYNPCKHWWFLGSEPLQRRNRGVTRRCTRGAEPGYVVAWFPWGGINLKTQRLLHHRHHQNKIPQWLRAMLLKGKTS